jgi:hypothetical protein
MDAHFTCVCRSIFVVRFLSTNRRSHGSMAFPHTAQTTGAGFLSHITSSHQRRRHSLPPRDLWTKLELSPLRLGEAGEMALDTLNQAVHVPMKIGIRSHSDAISICQRR